MLVPRILSSLWSSSSSVIPPPSSSRHALPRFGQDAPQELAQERWVDPRWGKLTTSRSSPLLPKRQRLLSVLEPRQHEAWVARREYGAYEMPDSPTVPRPGSLSPTRHGRSLSPLPIVLPPRPGSLSPPPRAHPRSPLPKVMSPLADTVPSAPWR